MQLSSDTINVLKNFADINQNILVKEGTTLTTISTMKNILAEADISDTIPKEFAIYDLPEFLRAIDMFQKPSLDFDGETHVDIADGNSKQKVKYFFADKSVIVTPTKSITMPDTFVSFTLKKESFADLMKGVLTLNLPDISVIGDGSTIKLHGADRKNSTSNTYSVDVGETDKTFKAHFKSENFKMVQDDYDVSISSQKISHFVNRNRAVKYWIALEPDSEF